jgi:hypothetical protein
VATQQAPLDWRVPIVNTDGTPTDSFMRLWNAQRTINGGIPAGADPTATIGTAAVNGTASTFMTSDSAPKMGNLTGDVTSLGLATTLKVVNSNVGTYGDATHIPVVTVNAKGLVTAASQVVVTIPAGANPTATASDAAVNGSAATFMRSDAAPAVQKASSSVFGLVKVDGTTITSAGGIISAVGGGASALTLLSEVITSSTSNVNFTSIPATYRDLEIRVRGAGAGAFNDIAICLQFNGDTSAVYDSQQTWFANTATTYAKTWHGNQLYTIQIAAASSGAQSSGSASIVISDYRGTTFYKSIYSIGHDIFIDVRSMVATGQWENTAAINSVKVFLSSGNFTNGSVVSLYGRM